MPYNSPDGDFDRIFMTSTEFVDQFVGSSVQSWGRNNNGSLGDGTTTDRSSPGTVAGGGVNWKQVASGTYAFQPQTHSAGIKTDGTLWTWGLNGNGQLGTGNTTARSSPGTTAGGGTNWKQVTCGQLISAAVKTDGTLWTWGMNSGTNAGTLGDGTTTDRSSPGTTAGGGTNWKQVSAAGVSMAAIKTDGTLWTWGYNAQGQLGDGTTSARSSPVTTAGGGTNWKQVSNNFSAGAAIKTDGTLWIWGQNGAGQLGDGTNTNRSSPVTTAGGGTNWKRVAFELGIEHSAAIKTDGTLWTWGNNANGRLGDGTTTGRNSPVTTAGGGTNWKQVTCGYYHTVAIKTDGTLWTWGVNNFGQLGDGTTTSKSSPVMVIGNVTNWKQVSSSISTLAVAQN
jgi:alpha-tubulin suppressor-like RCC1 family protein